METTKYEEVNILWKPLKYEEVNILWKPLKYEKLKPLNMKK